ncbi:MAG: hypothetical protein HC853_03905 [Anaerolineae bacterium]|nr:hypothetical protein [Anaerolineae bacterium]
MTTQETTSNRRKLSAILLLTTALSVVCLFALVASAVFAGGLVLSARPLPAASAAVPTEAIAGEVDPAASSKSVTSPAQAPSTQAQPQPAARVDSPLFETVPVETTQRQLRVFRQLWNIVNDRYVYPDFNGYDWKNAKTDAEARIKAGMSDEQFYELMGELIFNLNDEHSSFLSPQEAEEENKAYEGEKEYVGIGVLVESNIEKRYVYILQVTRAARRGSRPKSA